MSRLPHLLIPATTPYEHGLVIMERRPALRVEPPQLTVVLTTRAFEHLMDGIVLLVHPEQGIVSHERVIAVT